MVLAILVWYLRPPEMVPRPQEGLPMAIPVLTPTPPTTPILPTPPATAGGRRKQKEPTAPRPPRNPCHPWLEHYLSFTLAGIVHIFRVPHRSVTSTL
jgi:hypothetical protein